LPPPLALITSVTPVVCTSEPLVPVIVSEYVPGGAAAVVAAENVEEPPAACGFGEKEYVTPEIAGDAESVTLPLNPFCAVFDTV
jgi:hypothetical protein